MKTSTPDLFSSQSRQQLATLVQQFIDGLQHFNPDTLIACYEAMMKRPDRTRCLQQAKVPVLFIIGKYDMAVPLSDGLKQCYLPDLSYIHILQQSAHMGMMEEKTRCNGILEEFLLQNKNLKLTTC